MKRLLPILGLALLMFSCQQTDCTDGIQNGNETGIDCGGDCPPCSTTPTGGGTSTTNNTFQALQGTWYHHAFKSVVVTSTIAGGTYAQGFVKRGANCITEFTDTPYNVSLPDYYIYYGSLFSCSYPQAGFYEYNSTTNAINSALIELIGSDTLIFNSSGSQFLYTRTPYATSPSTVVDWEIQLDTPYPTNNEVVFTVTSNIPGEAVSVPVVAGQTYYSGTVTVNTSGVAPNTQIIIEALVPSGPTADVIGFSARYLLESFVVSEVIGQSYCIGGDVNSCSGFFPLNTDMGGSVSTFCMVGWQ